MFPPSHAFVALLLMIGGVHWGKLMEFKAELFGDYATDRDLEVNGVRIRLSADSDVWFLIKRAGGANRAYDREVARLSKPFKRELQRGTLDNETAEQKIIMPAFVRSCMLDWGGVKNDDGTEIQFTEYACKELFEKYPDIFNLLRDYSTEMATFRRVEMEETADRLGES